MARVKYSGLIYVLDHCHALWEILQHGTIETYLIGADQPLSNRAVLTKILSRMGHATDDFTPSPIGPGKDRRYAIDASQTITELVGSRNTPTLMRAGSLRSCGIKPIATGGKHKKLR